MINNENTERDQEKPTPETKPDDLSGIYVRGFLKISDPESGQTIVETGN
jgi:hypothetical protein